MKKNTFDLLLKIVAEEVEEVLESFYNSSNYIFFTLPVFRQKLIKYVFERIQKSKDCQIKNLNIKAIGNLPYLSLEFRLGIEKYIYEEIEYILENDLPLYFGVNNVSIKQN